MFLEESYMTTKTDAKKKKSNYFIEKEMIALVREYKATKSDKIFNQIAPILDTLINGMINKEFSYNHHIKNNRNDVISECMVEIIKSLNRYDPDRGRLFAYLNRIVKNTLLKYYTNSRKVKDKEMTYTDLTRNMTEDSSEDTPFKISMSNNNESAEKDIDINALITPKPKPKNVILDVDTSIYITYQYLIYVKESISFYLNNTNILYDLVDKLKYETTVVFDFNKYYKNKNIQPTENVLYKTILESLDISLSNILIWMKSTYADILIDEPKSFDGELSNRAVGYIRSFVKKKLKKENLIKHFAIEDLINLIQYLVYQRNMSYAKK